MGKYVRYRIFDIGRILRYRLVQESWGYEALVRFGCEHGIQEWIPTIELTFLHET